MADQTASFGIALDIGPSLAYVHSDKGTVTLIDRKAVDTDARERAICRALLQAALDLLDASESARAAGARALR